MVPEQLEPRLELLREEYVLVQAWKKTASYIRYHNWFSDTLALDCAAVNLPAFLDELRERLRSSPSWPNDPLRIVPAPKSQRWRVREGVWEPVEKRATTARLRPLAHVSLADQVVATALMLCLADRVETLQGDPRRPVRDQESRRQVVSYGNRLFCDAMGGELRHRWGSAKLYREYYQDYRTFLSRPEVVAESISEAAGKRVYVVHADLKQFYDRVRPDLLSAAINGIRRGSDDPGFFSLVASVLNWGWHPRDEGDVWNYAEQAELKDFTRVALPQGLVASGFFANVVLLPSDEALRAAIGTEIAPGILLADACRYVDDLRVLIAIDPNSDGSSNDLEKTVSRWLSHVLDENATGLALSPEKTQVAALGGEERPLVRQSAKMNRIQSAVSGGSGSATWATRSGPASRTASSFPTRRRWRSPNARESTPRSSWPSPVACAAALHRIRGRIEGPWDQPLAWIDTHPNRLWKARGAFPGLGSTLSAFGYEWGFQHGSLLAYEIELLREREGAGDPWALVDAVMEDPAKLGGPRGEASEKQQFLT